MIDKVVPGNMESRTGLRTWKYIISSPSSAIASSNFSALTNSLNSSRCWRSTSDRFSFIQMRHGDPLYQQRRRCCLCCRYRKILCLQPASISCCTPPTLLGMLRVRYTSLNTAQALRCFISLRFCFTSISCERELLLNLYSI